MRSPGSSAAPGTAYSDDGFRDHIRPELTGGTDAELNEFLRRIHYHGLDYNRAENYHALGQRLDELEKGSELPANRTIYLAMPAALYPAIIEQLYATGQLTEPEDGSSWRHVVLEKPFGRDTASAEELDIQLHRYLKEDQIYRIDHYLGKDTVQNIMMLRFANLIFEPVWNSHYIDHIQLTVAETLGVEHRAGYYDQSGLLRDMFQNHMLEMLAMAAMEMPSSFSADAVRDEKVKLIQSIRPFDLKHLHDSVVRAQYQGYLDEPGVKPDSTTETYVAAKLMIDNWRWSGVPFYLRSGKKLAKRKSEIAIVFKTIPHSIFAPIKASDHAAGHAGIESAAGRGDGADDPGQTARPEALHGGLEPELPLLRTSGRGELRSIRAAAAGRDARRPDVVHPQRRNRGELEAVYAGAGKLAA